MSAPAPAPTPIDYSDFEPVSIIFGKHSRHGDIGEQLSSLFGGQIPLASWRGLFTDTSSSGDLSQATVNDNFTQSIRNIIIDDMILPIATNTQGTDDAAKRRCVKAIVDRCPLNLGNSSMSVRLSTNGSTELKRVLRIADTRGGEAYESLYVMVQIQPIYLNPNIEEMDYLDFSEDHYRTSPFAGGPASSGAPGTLTMTSIAEAVAKGIASSSSSIGYGKSVLQGYSGPTSGYVFSPSTFPPDVLTRYENWRDKKIMPGSLIKQEYSTDDYYFQDPSGVVKGGGSERIVLADGTLFLCRDVSYNTLLKLPATKCTDTSHSGLRVWYYTITKQLMDHGVYVHPFWCFRENVGGYWGFDVATTAGSGQHADMPSFMTNPLLHMSTALHQHISKAGTFETKSEFAKIIRNCPSNGYRALKLIILCSHPSFIEDPAQYLSKYPEQRKQESVFEFVLAFNDYLLIQAYVLNQAQSLGDKQYKTSSCPVFSTLIGSNVEHMKNARASHICIPQIYFQTQSCSISMHSIVHTSVLFEMRRRNQSYHNSNRRCLLINLLLL